MAGVKAIVAAFGKRMRGHRGQIGRRLRDITRPCSRAVRQADSGRRAVRSVLLGPTNVSSCPVVWAVS